MDIVNSAMGAVSGAISPLTTADIGGAGESVVQGAADAISDVASKVPFAGAMLGEVIDALGDLAGGLTAGVVDSIASGVPGLDMFAGN